MKKNLPEKLKNLLNRLSLKQWLTIGFCILIVIINAYAVLKEQPIVPLLTGAAFLVYLLLFRLDLMIYLMALCTPFSVILENKDIHLGLSLPAEIIMIALTLLFLCRILYDLHLDRKLVTHPISIALFVYLGWMLFTVITSELPVVSIKFWLSKIWFTTSCYWVLIQFVKDDMTKAVRYFNCYAVALAVVVVITTYKHSLTGFDDFHGHWIMSPFYNDHTAYGAVLAFFLPITACCFFLPDNTTKKKIFYAILTVILTIGFYLSFSRAAWISLVVAIGVLIVLKLRIKLSWLVAGGLIVGTFLYFSAEEILYKMSRNSQDASGNLTEQLQSISNISTDASNVERLNRWNSAFGMIRERPLVGWGPGTYQFVYAPFQKSQFKTIITTDFGDGGNAHSEYIGPCAETGFPGLLTVLALVFVSLFTGIRTYNHSHDKTNRLLALMMTLALVTYFVHGFLNNFLDTDKLSLPFWGAFAVIMLTNLRMKEEQRVHVVNGEQGVNEVHVVKEEQGINGVYEMKEEVENARP
ncbi:MAG: O-antigen ligase family protein [Bacteroidales bacterium]|nr:O-antigen ligase family protein [Bacteroidales bacterium]